MARLHMTNSNVGLMVSLKVVLGLVLLVMNWVHLTSTLSDECRRNLDDGQDLSMIPVDITCTTLLNGTFNTWWTVRDHVQLVTLDYNCTGFGEDQAENLHSWVEGFHGEPILDIVNLRPNASTNSSHDDPTCYVDGCFVWSSGRGLPLTWSIPTVTCNLSTILQTVSSTTLWSTEVSSVVIPTSTATSTTDPTVTTTTQPISGGLKGYIWLMLTVLLVSMLAIILVMLFIIIWRVKRKRKRNWWLYGTKRDKTQLLGNEPCIDPVDRVKNDYFETITIVDPLELPEQVQSGIGMTTMIIPVHVENHFLQDFNQQAGDSEGHSFSESGSSGNEDGSIRVESANGGDAENDSLSACTQIIENGGDIVDQQSDLEEERLTSDDINAKGASAHVRPASLNLPPTEREMSHSNEVVSPSEAVISSTSQDKICCLSTDDNQKKPLCAESSPEHSGNGVSLMAGSNTKPCVRPTSLNLRKHSSPPQKREKLSHPNQISSNTEGASAHAHVRPTSLNLQVKHCPPFIEREEFSRPNQITKKPNLEGKCVRPTSLNLGIKRSPPCAETAAELSHPNQNSSNKAARVRPTFLNLGIKHSPPSTETTELSHPNQNSNTKAAHVRPTSLNHGIKHCPDPATEIAELLNPNQNSNTKGARIRPTLGLKYCPSDTETAELSHSNQSSNIKGANAHVKRTALNVQNHCPPPTEREPNQIQTSTEVASPPEPDRMVVTSTSIHEASRGSASASVNVNDSLEIDSSPVLEQVYKNVDSEDPNHDSRDHTREHLHYRQALQLSRFGPLSIIPEEPPSSHSEDQTRYPYPSSPSYISSSECTSSVYSSAQGANCRVGYLADIEDMDSTSLQSDLESDEGTKGELDGENRNKCEPESIQEMMQRLLHLSIPPHVHVQWYNNSAPHQPLYWLSDESEPEYFYIATVPPIELPDSPCSARGYIGMLPQAVLPDDDVDTFGLEYEVMARPAEHTDTPSSGYIVSNGAQNEVCDDVHQNRHETTV